jgi:hypothetical protein
MNYPKDDVIKGQVIIGFFNSFICTTANFFFLMDVCIRNITLFKNKIKIMCVNSNYFLKTSLQIEMIKLLIYTQKW